MLLQSLASCIRTVRLRGSLSCVKMAVGILALTSQITNWIAPLGKVRNSVFLSIKCLFGTSLVVQWLKIGRPMQGTWVRALVREDPTRHRATKPMRHNY